MIIAKGDNLMDFDLHCTIHFSHSATRSVLSVGDKKINLLPFWCEHPQDIAHLPLTIKVMDKWVERSQIIAY